MSSVSALIVLGNRKAHDDSNNEASQVTQVVNVGFGQTYLDVEQKDQEDEDDQSEALHWVGLSQSSPFYAEISNL